MPDFQPWPKIARLNRETIVTEKIDGTNAAILIEPTGSAVGYDPTGNGEVPRAERELAGVFDS